MPQDLKYCISTNCLDSANLMCDHESFLATQYERDQLKFASRFQPDHARTGFIGYDALLFDQSAFASCGAIKDARSMRQSHEAVNSRINELLMDPCGAPTFANSLSCSKNECCSRSHQLFWNHTKQGTGRLILD